MEKETLLKGEYQEDPELQRNGDEPVLEWMMRIDAIMFTRTIKEKVEAGAESTNHMYPESTEDTREEVSGLFEV